MTAVVRWTGVDTAYAGLYTGDNGPMNWMAPQTATAYRCMWTNELR